MNTGTPVPGHPHVTVEAFALRLYIEVKAKKYQHDPPLPEGLLHVIEHLSGATLEYPRIGDSLGGGAVVHFLSLAGRELLELAVHHKAPVVIWDGMDRHHTRFWDHMFSTQARILRLRESYPVEALSMIERLAATWVSRKEFWVAMGAR